MKKLILLLIALIAAVIWLRPWVDSLSSESFSYDLNNSLADLKQNFTQSTDNRKKSQQQIKQLQQQLYQRLSVDEANGIIPKLQSIADIKAFKQQHCSQSSQLIISQDNLHYICDAITDISLTH